LLRTLDDPDMRARFLFLPEHVANWAERRTPIKGAFAMQIAAAIAILQSAPLRIANLAGLRLDRHLVRPGVPRSLWQIDIPRHEVKNDQPLVHELPRRVTTLLDRYIRRFRPALAAPGNPYLFPVGSTQSLTRIIAADPGSAGPLGWDRHDPASIQALRGTRDAAT
jgi:integrase